MKAGKVFVAVGIAATLGLGVSACGTPYTGEGVVVEKDTDKKTTKKKKKNGSSSSSRSTDYDLIVDIPGSDKNKTIDVTKTQYDSVKVGQTVKIENGKFKKK